jgi:glucose/arabinose dehydrogenase
VANWATPLRGAIAWLPGVLVFGLSAAARGALAAAVVVTALAPLKIADAAPAVPSGFADTVAISGLNLPTALAFASDGRVFVGEKSGLIKVFDSLSDPSPMVFADLRPQVHNHIDRGLLGLTLDPEFPTRPYVYVLYTYDAEPGGVHPRWGTDTSTSDDCPNPPGATIDGCVVQARLARLPMNAGGTADAEQVLVTGWCQQFPSHSVGTVAFGSDGALYAGAGDGASYNFVDYGQVNNRCGDPPSPAGTDLAPPSARGGALRSQSPRRPAGDPASLDGTIIRVDPDTGAGMAGNPFAASSDLNARRVIAYGLRNPFRFTPRPGTKELWLGDVGWGTHEEINRIPTIDDNVAENFGWPCYEGSARQDGYDAANLTACESLYAGAAPTAPYYSYRHDSKVVGSDACPAGGSSIAGIAFEDGSNYPASYDGALFFADSSRGCIWAMRRGSGGSPDPTQIVPVVSDAGTPVQVVTGLGGDIFYVDLLGGTVHRLVYHGANHPPTAVISASPTSGAAPLTVSFDGSESTDLDSSDSLTYAWDLDADGQFDDGNGSASSFTYSSNGAVDARLRVTDNHGASDTKSVMIQVGPPNSLPVPVIETPAESLRWKVGDSIGFSGRASDAEDSALPPSRLSWTVTLNHCPSNCHPHPMQDFAGVSTGSFSAPDHEYPSTLTLTLTATDSTGAKASTSRVLSPQTVNLTFASNPTGLRLGLLGQNITAPVTRTVIVGSSNSVSAPSPQTVSGRHYEFVQWSDGGANSHNITAPATPTTYTATFRQVSTPVGCPQPPSSAYRMPSPAGPASVARLSDGRFAYSALGSDGRLYLTATAIQSHPVTVGPLECYSAPVVDDPANPAITDNPSLAQGTGFLALFARSTDNQLWQRTLTASGNGQWSQLPIGGLSANGPAAIVTPDNVVHLIVRGLDGDVWHASRRGQTWSAWESIGGGMHGTPSVALRPGGGLAIAIRGLDDAIWLNYGNTGSWTGWFTVGGRTLSSPALMSGVVGDRLDLFVPGTAGGLWQNETSGGAWVGWHQRDNSLPASARISGGGRDFRVVLYATTNGTTTYTQFAGTWTRYVPAPYSCPTCHPASTGGSPAPR